MKIRKSGDYVYAKIPNPKFTIGQHVVAKMFNCIDVIHDIIKCAEYDFDRQKWSYEFKNSIGYAYEDDIVSINFHSFEGECEFEFDESYYDELVMKRVNEEAI